MKEGRREEGKSIEGRKANNLSGKHNLKILATSLLHYKYNFRHFLFLLAFTL